MPSESEWHMIIGGKNVQDLSTVELFNWRTGEQCPLKDLPIKVRIHSGTVFDGVPIICGGFSNEELISSCYTYSSEDNNWKPVSSFRLFEIGSKNKLGKINKTKRLKFMTTQGSHKFS